MTNHPKSCDVIIPVYNNAKVLTLSMSSLVAQYVPHDWVVRVIISDDGSTDGGVLTAQNYCRQAGWEFEVVNSEHAGVAHARNQALNIASGDIVFFLGADIILQPGAMASHLQFHREHPDEKLGALGMVQWDPRVLPSPFMEWMVHGGQQNDFDGLLGVQEADPAHFFYGSHISLKRLLLHDELFSENFTNYGWEDLDLGRRLKSKGFILSVLHDARGLHHHYYSVKNILERQYLSGCGLVVYQKLYPNIELLPTSASGRRLLRRIVFCTGVVSLARLIAMAFGRKINSPKLFALLTAAEFWRGIASVKDNN